MTTLRFPPLLLLAVALLASAALQAQTINKLLSSYSFENGMATAGLDDREPDDGIISGNPTVTCGVVEGGLLLDGGSDYISFPGGLNNIFSRADFLVSVYFHPVSATPRQTLIRKRAECDTDGPGLVVDYLPNPRSLAISLVETSDAQVDLQVPLPEDRCWYHLVLARENNVVEVYIDGRLVASAESAGRLDLSGDTGNFELGRTACPDEGGGFAGFVDELRIYNGALDRDERNSLFLAPDRIAPLAFPVVNIGTEVVLEIPNTCATGFVWEPQDRVVANADSPTPTVLPVVSTEFTVQMSYAESPCVSRDTVLLQVFDPEGFDCTEVQVPSAFTPDGFGPPSNEVLIISNQALIQSFSVFEIYDRWGNRVFTSTDVTLGWDGTYDGEPAMPGPYLWRASYGCNDEDLQATGTVTLIR